MREQGHVTDGVEAAIDVLPDSYDALDAMARKLPELPLREDWPYVEPNELEGFWGECDPSRARGEVAPGHLEERWLRPFNDEIRTALAWFYERSLSKLARRMGELPGRIGGELAKTRATEDTEDTERRKN